MPTGAPTWEGIQCVVLNPRQASARGRGMWHVEQMNDIRERFSRIRPVLNEVQRRYWVAIEAQSLGRGGLSLVAAATGVSQPMIRRGLREVRAGMLPDPQRQRRPGGGRKPLLKREVHLLKELLCRITGAEAAAHQTPLLWAAASTGQLAAGLTARGHRVSAQSVTALLSERGYRLRATRSITSARAQQHCSDLYRYLSARTAQFLRCGQPVLYVRVEHGTSAGSCGRRAHAGSVRPDYVLGAVQWWWRQHDTAAITGAREALLALDLELSTSLSAAWMLELRRLAGQLKLRLQLCTLPSGIHRFQTLSHEAMFSLKTTQLTAEQRHHSILVALVGETPDAALVELRRRLYHSCYARGLVTGRGGDSHSVWSLSASG